ncbi:MAG: transporter [Betaproteobacteria bacterium]|nr:transporter [Betaproteobacteria bacterium]
MLCALVAASPIALAGEGGTSHIMPGANATLMDLPPTSPGGFFKPMYINYQGSASARVPTAAGVVANLNADANTLVLGGATVWSRRSSGVHITPSPRSCPYTWLSISGNSAALGGVEVENSVSGIGDLTVVPVMLAWKSDSWQYDFLMPVYAPTGSYEVGRLGNTGLNYWTFDPIVGAAYSNAKTGFNAAAHLGYAINTENNDTQYKSGNVLHLDASVQQIVPLGSGFATIGAEAWYFQQVTCDSGSGATLGCFKGRTAGIGPVLGYIQPIGKEKLLFEFKWLPELETKNRLNGDYIWLKMVYTF